MRTGLSDHRKRQHLLAFLLTAALILCAAETEAHNGAVALVWPLDGITVDGDLSDWPEDLPRYELTRPEFGDPPTGPADLSANMGRRSAAPCR